MRADPIAEVLKVTDGCAGWIGDVARDLRKEGTQADQCHEILQQLAAELKQINQDDLIPNERLRHGKRGVQTIRALARVQRALLKLALESTGSASPVVHLTNWKEILDALELKSDDKAKVMRLNRDFHGPIVPPKKGSRPLVDKHELLEWWNGLKQRMEQQQERHRDRQATVENSYKHGRDAMVVPEIAGSIKRRRQRAQRDET